MAANFPTPFPRGFRLIDGGKLNTLFSNGGTPSIEDGITATAGGVQATARLLTCQMNRISVCATNNDAVKLPPVNSGITSVLIINDGAATAQVFGSNSDTIDGVATATGVVLTNAKRAWYYLISVSGANVGAWISDMGIKSA